VNLSHIFFVYYVNYITSPTLDSLQTAEQINLKCGYWAE